MMDIRDQARNKWASILDSLGIDGDLLTGKHGPCPICAGKDRFRFDNQDGRGTWICNVCGAGDGMHLLILKTKMSFAEAAKQIRGVLGEAVETKPPAQIDPEITRTARRALWSGSVPIGNDEAMAYLTGRGLRGPYPQDLRFHASAEVTDHPRRSRLPAMLALVRGSDGAPQNIHRTYLENGLKADMRSPRKMMPGKLPEGSAIRLGEHDGRLGIAEGIETALAVKRDFGITCWSAINSTLLEKFIVPQGVTELHIFGDNDPKFGGQAAAYRCAYRNATRPNAPSVFVKIPEIVATDWASEHPEALAS